MVTVVTQTHSDDKEDMVCTDSGDGPLSVSSHIDPHLAGQQLARAREEKSFTIADVAQQTHIRQQYLISMEKGDVESLPGHVYAVGFVKTYAACLGLDPAELLEQFGLNRDMEADYSAAKHAAIPPDQQQRPSALIIRLSILFILLLIGGLLIGQNWGHKLVQYGQDTYMQDMKDKTLHKEPSVSGHMSNDAAHAQTSERLGDSASAFSSTIENTHHEVASMLRQPEPRAVDMGSRAHDALRASAAAHMPPPLTRQLVPSSAAVPLEIVATQQTWVQVLDQDQTIIFVQLMHPGDRYTIPLEKTGLLLTTGNAGGVHLAQADHMTEALGQPGQVLRGISIDREKQRLQDTE